MHGYFPPGRLHRDVPGHYIGEENGAVVAWSLQWANDYINRPPPDATLNALVAARAVVASIRTYDELMARLYHKN